MKYHKGYKKTSEANKHTNMLIKRKDNSNSAAAEATPPSYHHKMINFICLTHIQI